MYELFNIGMIVVVVVVVCFLFLNNNGELACLIHNRKRIGLD